MWHDATDERPRFIFDVQLKDGSVVEAMHIMGSWETLDGRVLYPEKFRFKECRVAMVLSDLPRGLTMRAADLCQACGSSLVSGTTPKNGKQSCPVCGTSR